MALITVYDAMDELTATSICDLLRQNDVAAAIDHDGLSVIFGGIQFAGKPSFHILINAEDEEKAVELIGGFLGTLGELAEFEGIEEEEEEPSKG